MDTLNKIKDLLEAILEELKEFNEKHQENARSQANQQEPPVVS
jgi:hypothetical protein